MRKGRQNKTRYNATQRQKFKPPPRVKQTKAPPIWHPPPSGPFDAVQGPEDLTLGHYEKAFNIIAPPCSRKKRKRNCSENPNCLYGLGEDSDGVWTGKPHFPDNPENEARDADAIVGIENLGATCYIGSLLQCLYMNPNFRQGVFEWKDASKKSEAPDTISLELQNLFTEMLLGARSSVSPLALVKAINISTSMQQDAQEFAKLFVSYLEERFAKSKNPVVKNLMDQFRGKATYITTCENCKNSSTTSTEMYDLELNVKGMSCLEDCLASFLKNERLTEGNQYLCETCGGLQDATRRITISRLPEVLNIQLLRYVYDVASSSKKKLSNPISFPFELDVAKSINQHTPLQKGESEMDEGADQPESHYTLTAVLMHLGLSANSGHYIAHVRDPFETEVWWEFNDSKVSSLQKDRIGLDEDQQKPKRRRQKSVETRVSSCNAYMLIYTRNDRQVCKETKPSPDSMAIIEKKNDAFAERRHAYLVKYEEERARMQQRCEEYEKVFSSFICKPDAKKYYWLPTDWLKSWVIGSEEAPIDNSVLCCEHGTMVCPQKISIMKRISQEGWKYFTDKYGGTQALSDDDYCQHCLYSWCKERALESAAERKKSEILHNLAHYPAPKDGYWISTTWLNQWKKKNTDELGTDINWDITCDHQNLSNKQTGRRVVSVEIWSYLRSLYPEGVEFPSSFDGCRECRLEDEARESEMADRKALRAEEKALAQKVKKQNNNTANLPIGTYFMIPSDWFESWHKYTAQLDVESPPGPINNAPFICSHGLLNIDESDEDRIYVLTEEQWVGLKNIYEAETEIRYVVTKSDKSLIPSTCEECRKVRVEGEEAQRLNFSNGIIYVSTDKACAPAASRTHGHNLRIQRARKEAMYASSSDTIYHLKLMICESFGIDPGAQRLFLKETELKDSQKQLSQYGIGLRDVIFMEQQELVLDEVISTISNGHAKEQGFVGSSLLVSKGDREGEGEAEEEEEGDGEEGEGEGDEEEEEEEEEEENGASGKGGVSACAQCTFDNPAGAVTCEICDSPLN